MKTLNLRKGQRTKQRNRILVDLITKIWDSKNWKTEKLTVRLDWTFGNTKVQSNRTVSFSDSQWVWSSVTVILPPVSNDPDPIVARPLGTILSPTRHQQVHVLLTVRLKDRLEDYHNWSLAARLWIERFGFEPWPGTFCSALAWARRFTLQCLSSLRCTNRQYLRI